MFTEGFFSPSFFPFPLFVGLLHRYLVDSNVFLAYRSRGLAHVLMPPARYPARGSDMMMRLIDQLDIYDCTVHTRFHYRLRMFC